MSEKQGFEQKHPTQTTMVSTPPRALESRLRAPQIPLSADIPLSKAVGGDQTSTTISTPTTAKDRRIGRFLPPFFTYKPRFHACIFSFTLLYTQ